MADTTYDTHLKDITTWLETTGSGTAMDITKRKFCTLGLTKLDNKSIQTYFSRVDVNQLYEDEFNKKKLTNNPVAYLQQDSDGLFALQKSYVLRHQGRLANYRDDAEQKDFRIYNAINLGRAKLTHLKNLANGS